MTTLNEWLIWVAECEKLFGHHLDGDQVMDGYSLDGAHDAFCQGYTPAEYFQYVQRDKGATAAARITRREWRIGYGLVRAWMHHRISESEYYERLRAANLASFSIVFIRVYSWRSRLYSTDSQTADIMLQDAPGWTSTHHLKGLAYLAIRLRYDPQQFSGRPEVTAVVRGRKVYDDREEQA